MSRQCGPGFMRVSGKVSSGLGRAHVFMFQKHYQSQFKGVLGVGAWPGTLNVDVGGDSIDAFLELRVLAGLDEGVPDDSIEAHRMRASKGTVSPSGERRHSREGFAEQGANGRNVPSWFPT